MLPDSPITVQFVPLSYRLDESSISVYPLRYGTQTTFSHCNRG